MARGASLDLARSFCNSTLASYSYNSSNGKLARISYGNGFAVNYYYDALDRISQIVYNKNGTSETVMSYTYDSGGRLYSSTDHRTGETVRYDYDPAGKLLASYVANSSGDVLGGASYEYDENGRISASDVRIDVSGSVEREELSYIYNRDGNLSLRVSVNGALIGNITPTYDNLGRTVQRTLDYSAGGDVFYGNIGYSYLQRNGQTTALVSQYTFSRGVSGTLTSSTYNFEYDLAGNITQITDSSNVIQNKYYYDDLYQLIREDNRALDKTYVWTYDNAGNILSKTTYAFTTGELGSVQETLTYSYGNSSWGDQLTSTSDWVYTYDSIGNPLTKTSADGTEGYRYVWEGRRLVEIIKCWYDDGVLTYEDPFATFTYNSDGIRTSVSGNYVTAHEYVLDGSQILSDTMGNSTFIYLYDEMGSPIGIKYRTTSYAANDFDYFFYEKNLQGDIVAIYNESGTKIATYTYDAWGNFTKTQTSGVTYSAADTFVYNNNPFTYRGYYYDSETGLYYLQTRYYDASIGRFISSDAADVIAATPTELTDKNLYAYCDNNPVMRTDEDGEFWNIIAGAVIGGVVSAVSQLIEDPDSWKTGEFWLKVGVSAGIGAISGGVAASTLKVGGQMAVNAALNAVDSIAENIIDGEQSIAEYVVDALDSATSGLIAGRLGGNGTGSKHVSEGIKKIFKRGNFKYYFSQTKTLLKRETKHAVRGIFKSAIPAFLDIAISAAIKYGGGS